METIEYRFVDKSPWGEGPWTDEPDKKQWQDAETGLPCLIVRSEVTGALCGYVGVSPGHPWYRKELDEIEASIHGGISYTSPCMEQGEHSVCHKVEPGEPDDVWWAGFDCAHAWDLAPAMNARLRSMNRPQLLRDSTTYRNWDYVTAEVENLARQARAVGDEGRSVS